MDLFWSTSKIFDWLQGCGRFPKTFFRFGRRFLLIVSTGGTTVSLATLTGYFLGIKYGYKVLDWIPLAALLFYAVFSKLGLSFVPIIMMGKLDQFFFPETFLWNFFQVSCFQRLQKLLELQFRS